MPDSTDPAETVLSISKRRADGEMGVSTPVNDVHFEFGAFRLLTCKEGVQATVEVYAPLLTNGWRSNSPRSKNGDTLEQPIAYRYKLTNINGEWRAETLQDITAAENFNHDHSLDYLKPWAEAMKSSGGAMTTLCTGRRPARRTCGPGAR